MSKEKTMSKETKSKTVEKKGVDRRAFLRGVGVSAGAAGVVAVASGGVAEAAPVKGDRKTAGYHETDHVRRAYDLARF